MITYTKKLLSAIAKAIEPCQDAVIGIFKSGNHNLVITECPQEVIGGPQDGKKVTYGFAFNINDLFDAALILDEELVSQEFSHIKITCVEDDKPNTILYVYLTTPEGTPTIAKITGKSHTLIKYSKKQLPSLLFLIREEREEK